MAVSFGAAVELGTNAVIFYSSPIPNRPESVSSFPVLLVPFFFVLLLKSFTYIFMMVSHLENCRMCT